MSKERWHHVVLGLILTGLTIFGLVAFVPTRDDGLRWFNEEFWVTLVITFLSVAASIGLTVWISLWVLRKQLAADREAQEQERRDQVEAVRNEFARERRVRSAEGLPEKLETWADAMVNLANKFAIGNEWLFVYLAGPVESALTALSSNIARLRVNNELYEPLNELLAQTRDWVQIARQPIAEGDAGEAYVEEWRFMGKALAGEIWAIQGWLPDWEEHNTLNESVRTQILERNPPLLIQLAGKAPRP